MWLGISDVMGFSHFCSPEQVTWPLHATATAKFVSVFVETGSDSVSPDSLIYPCGLLMICPLSPREAPDLKYVGGLGCKADNGSNMSQRGSLDGWVTDKSVGEWWMD